jgi:p-aminobenzoyl-glutamate transporter AbgT
MIDMYCSEQVIFVPIHDTMTDAINVPVDFAIESMFYTISLTLVAMTFGGVLEYSGMLKALITQILKIAPRLNNSSTSLLPESIVYPVCSAVNASVIVPPCTVIINSFNRHSSSCIKSTGDSSHLYGDCSWIFCTNLC